MKGSLISVRIADFLKAYPPFSYLDFEALRALASQSKVSFHEDGEIVFSQSQPRDRWLYVIQKGSVEVIEEGPSSETLIDLRGPGDLLGLQGIRSEEPYLHTCRTQKETILYGLPREAFIDVARANPKSRRYLAAYFSLNPAYRWDASHPERVEEVLERGVDQTLSAGGLFQRLPPHSHAHADLVTVKPGARLHEVATFLQSKRIECVLIVDDEGRALGKLTDADFRDHLSKRGLDPSMRAGDLMFTDLVAVRASEHIGDLILKLTQSGKHYLIVTEDGTLESRAVGMVTERSLALQFGRFPTFIGEAITSAKDIPTLRALRDRLEWLALEFLQNRESLKWLMGLTGIINRKMSHRILQLVEMQMQAEGLGSPPCPYSWLMMGSGGRNELLIRSAVYHALVYEDAPADACRDVERYFAELAARAGEGLRQCGFLESPQGILAQNPDWCLSLSEMKARFSRMISDPLGQHVYSARDAFDFQTVTPANCTLAEELDRHINAELAGAGDFIRYMARDSLINQPPRTIFQGYVVDREGIRRKDLAIKFHALLPLVDVGRVFALQSGFRQPTPTYQRLLNHARAHRENAEVADLFNEAAEAFLVAQYARISQGLKSGTDGAVLQPEALTSADRTLLVTAFRTILRMLEFTSDAFKLSWNRL
jgi:CBS domain-containing protein